MTKKIHLYDKIISPIVTEKSTNQSELNKSDVINASVMISDRKTFYTKYGNLFSILNLFILILVGLFIALKKIKKND